MIATEHETGTGLYEVDHDDSGYCHIIGDDGGYLCGAKPPPLPGEPTLGTHVISRPGESICDGCGSPRCPKCRAEWNGGAA